MKLRKAVTYMLLAALLFSATPLLTPDAYAMTGTSMAFKDGVSKYLSKGDTIHYGHAASGYAGTPVWRIGNPKGSNTEEPGAIFLISEYTWRGPEDSIVYNLDCTKDGANKWQGSDAQTWCKAFYQACFTDEEKARMLSYDKYDRAGSWLYTAFDESSLTKQDVVFWLSAQEVYEYLGFSPGKKLKATDADGNVTAYWLRSPAAGSSNQAGDVDGIVGAIGKNRVDQASVPANGAVQPYAARPAFNLKADDLLFASTIDAKNGATGVMKSMTASTSSKEVKLTFKDPGMSVSAGLAKNDGTNVTFGFSGATEGSYVSVMTEYNGLVKYYGRMAKNATSGTITVPYSCMKQGESLYIFTERAGGKYDFDYASEPVRISVPAPPKPEPKKEESKKSSGSADAKGSVSTKLPSVKIAKVAAAKRTIVVKWPKLSKARRKKIDGIEVQYSRKKNFKKATVKKVKKTATVRRITRLKRKTGYYVRVRTYKGKKHSKWSAAKRVKTK